MFCSPGACRAVARSLTNGEGGCIGHDTPQATIGPTGIFEGGERRPCAAARECFARLVATKRGRESAREGGRREPAANRPATTDGGPVGWWSAIRGPDCGTSRTSNPALHTAFRDRDNPAGRLRPGVSRTPSRSRCKQRSRRADASRATPASRLKRTASNPLVLASGDDDHERNDLGERHDCAADIELFHVKHPNLPSCSI